MSKAKTYKPLQEQIEEYKNQPEFHNKYRHNVYNQETRHWENKVTTAWHWDENWDGQLIKDVIALEQAGFIIVSFSRKRKITLKLDDEIIWYQNNGINERAAILDKIIGAIGDTWYSISFKPTLSIYFKGRSSNWRY